MFEIRAAVGSNVTDRVIVCFLKEVLKHVVVVKRINKSHAEEFILIVNAQVGVLVESRRRWRERRVGIKLLRVGVLLRLHGVSVTHFITNTIHNIFVCKRQGESLLWRLFACNVDTLRRKNKSWI